MSTTDNTITPTLKQCSKKEKCINPNGSWLPLTDEYYRARVHRGKPTFYSQCRVCEHRAQKVYDEKRQQNPEYKIKQSAYNKKRCKTEAYKANRKQYSSSPEYKAKKRASRQTPQYKEYKKEYRKSEKHKAYMKEYQHTAKYKAYLKSYLDNPDIRVARKIIQLSRYTRSKSLPNNFTEQDWRRCLDHFGNRCAVCGRPVGFWHTLAMDHWMPLSSPICPGTIPTNIVPLCHGDGGCNNSKKDKNALEWLTDKFGKRKASVILKRIQEYFDSLGVQ